MGDTVISVENLGKKYVIGHQGERGKYVVLRDVISEKASGLWNCLTGQLFNRKKSDSTKEDFWALKDVSFKVKQGERIGIIGRNGAGKSTLLKVLSRITEPTTGKVTIKGRVASLLEVGTGFHPELTGRENIYLNGAILGMRRAEIRRKFDEIVQFAEVEKFLDTPVKRYSSGMYVRLAFAVAAHLEPEILVVDEVLAVGDVQFQKKCLGKMGEVSEKEGRTVLFVSHNMGAIQRLCSRLILLDQGKIIEDGYPNQVIDKYLLQGVEKKGERIWKNKQSAPGSEYVRLKAVRVVDVHDKVVNSIDVKEDFALEVEYWILKSIENIVPSFYFYDESGDLVFLSRDCFRKGWWGKPRDVGLYSSKCFIPGNLLNEGRLSVLIGLSKAGEVSHIAQKDVISFQLTDNMQEGGARGMFYRDWPGGAVRPLLKWETEFIKEGV